MLIGLLFGAIAGAVTAFLLKPESAEGPFVTNEEASGITGKMKRHIEEAREAARQAADEKEAEMRRRFEEAKS